VSFSFFLFSFFPSQDVAQDGATFTQHLAILAKESQRLGNLRQRQRNGLVGGGGGAVSGAAEKADAWRLVEILKSLPVSRFT